MAVIGCPAEHSLSPCMQNAALAAARLDFVYTAHKVEPQDLAAAVTGFRALNYRGFNVTVPHKEKIMPFLDAIDITAQKIGAVNTVVNDRGKLTGYNTDAEGFIKGLYKALGENDTLCGKTALILGAGGAARAVLYGLMGEGTAKIYIAARNFIKAKELTVEFADIASETELAPILMKDGDADFAAATRAADITVNATPLGMAGKDEANRNNMPPVDFALAKKNALAYDLIYTPAETKFLQRATAHGLKTQNGEDMLIFQGAAAFCKWTGQSANTTVMKEALQRALAGK